MCRGSTATRFCAGACRLSNSCPTCSRRRKESLTKKRLSVESRYRCIVNRDLDAAPLARDSLRRLLQRRKRLRARLRAKWICFKSSIAGGTGLPLQGGPCGGVGPRALPSAKVGAALWAEGSTELAPPRLGLLFQRRTDHFLPNHITLLIHVQAVIDEDVRQRHAVVAEHVREHVDEAEPFVSGRELADQPVRAPSPVPPEPSVPGSARLRCRRSSCREVSRGPWPRMP